MQAPYLTEALAHACCCLQQVSDDVARLPGDEVVRIQRRRARIEHLEAGRVPCRVGRRVSKALLPEADRDESITSCSQAIDF